MTTFKAIPITYLHDRTTHPEVEVQNFDRVRYQVRLGRYNAVLAHYGEIIGFLLKDLPEAVPVSDRQGTFTREFLQLKSLRKLQDSGAIRLTYITRGCGWYVPAKHQDLLPIPVLFAGSDR